MSRLEFYLDLYKIEIEKRRELNGNILVPITIFIALFSTISYLFSHWPLGQISRKIELTFFAILAVTSISILLSIYQIAKFYGNFFEGYETKELPYLEDIEMYFQRLSDQKLDENIIEEKFEAFQIQKLVEVTTSYQESNERKLKYFFTFKRLVIVNTVLCAVSGLIYIIASFYISSNS